MSEENCEHSKLPPGKFCWQELLTPDAEAAKAFYGRVFGWGASEMDMGDFVYHMFEQDGEPVAGMIEITPEMQGAVPCWMSYVAVADADAALSEAIAAGGNAIKGVTDIPGKGRFAVVVDPTGAVISFWQNTET